MEPLLVLEQLLATADFVYLTTLPHEEEPARYRLSYHQGGRSHCVSAGSLAELCQRLNDSRAPRRRTCPGCGEVKGIEEFPRRTNRESGRASRCRACYARRKRLSYVPRAERREQVERLPI